MLILGKIGDPIGNFIGGKIGQGLGLRKRSDGSFVEVFKRADGSVYEVQRVI